MKISKMSEMVGGWFVGDFEPSVYKTSDFLVCYKQHYKGEIWDNHYHKVATEVNYLIRGEMKINDVFLQEGDIFLIEPNEVSVPEFLTDCELIVVKTPSIKGDKYII